MKMKKIIPILLITAVLALMESCAGTPKFSDVSGKTWKLVEIKYPHKIVKFHRQTLINEGYGDIFTLTFDSGNLSGAGAPNRYTAPYALTGKNGINVRPMRSTLMASIYDPEKLRETDFFLYMQNASEWTVIAKHLHITTKNTLGEKITLIFAL
jgi:heat shock protein HslJ